MWRGWTSYREMKMFLHVKKWFPLTTSRLAIFFRCWVLFQFFLFFFYFATILSTCQFDERGTIFSYSFKKKFFHLFLMSCTLYLLSVLFSFFLCFVQVIIYVYIYIYIYIKNTHHTDTPIETHAHIYSIRIEFSKFLDFFVQAFKIVVDFWKLSMLLLYILWDDWPIFIISLSNEQQQQELELASTQFLTFPVVQTLLPVTFSYSLSSEAVVMRELRRWKRLWRRSLTRSRMRPYSSYWNGTTSAFQPEQITSKGTRVSCVYYQQKCPYEKSLETYLMILLLQMLAWLIFFLHFLSFNFFSCFLYLHFLTLSLIPLFSFIINIFI